MMARNKRNISSTVITLTRRKQERGQEVAVFKHLQILTKLATSRKRVPYLACSEEQKILGGSPQANTGLVNPCVDHYG
jgi:hypothetical protein